MHTIRYYFRLIGAFLFRFKEILIISVGFGIILFLLFSFLAPKLLGKATEKVALVGRFSTSELPYDILHLIGEGLTVLDPAGNPLPALAEKWETPDKGLTWIFTLKSGITWQDGSEVVANPAMYSFEDVEVNIIDPKTISFKLKNAFAPFPTVVSKPTFKRGLLGTGAWSVKNVSLAGGFVERLEIGDREGNTKIYKFYPTEERSKLAFKLGEVDEILDVVDPRPFDKWDTVKLKEEVNQKRFVAVFFNTHDALLSDKKIRQALSYAIDKDQFVGSQRALGPIPPTSWAYNSQIKPYEFDKKRAIELIGGQSLDIKLVTNPFLLDSAEMIAKNWEGVGVHTSVSVSSILPEDFQAFLVMYDTPSDPDQYSTWHSTQFDTNITRYHNERVDSLLESGRSETDFETRKKMYLDFQRYLLEDAPAAFLYHPISYTIIRK